MRHRIPVRTVLATMMFLALAARPALAQFDRGQIAGFVKDETGGVIPGAAVTATHTPTAIGRTLVTHATGYYLFTALTPRAYDVALGVPGLQKKGDTRGGAG